MYSIRTSLKNRGGGGDNSLDSHIHTHNSQKRTSLFRGRHIFGYFLWWNNIAYFRNKWGRHSAFTLIEMMIVISIIGLLAGVAYPLSSLYFRQARDTQRESSLHQLVQAHHTYFTDHNSYPTRNPESDRANCVSTDLTSGHPKYLPSLPTSPSWDHYDEWCWPNGQYAYGVSTDATLATLMATMEGDTRGNYNPDNTNNTNTNNQNNQNNTSNQNNTNNQNNTDKPSINDLRGDLALSSEQLSTLNSSLTPKSGKYLIHTLGYIDEDSTLTPPSGWGGWNGGWSGWWNTPGNPTPTTGTYTYSDWSVCSLECWWGTQTRTRTGCNYDSCTPENPDTSQSCNTHACTPPEPCQPIKKHENNVTIIANPCATAWQEYNFEWTTYYIAKDKADLKAKIQAWYPANRIVTTRVTDMSYLFQLNTTFNQPIGNWDTSNVTSMYRMFAGALESGNRITTTIFNQDISHWDTSNVRSMGQMFFLATAFNKDIGNWNTSKVVSMNSMFYRATSFNKNLRTNGDQWNVANVTDMYWMFFLATQFNGDISNWDTSKVTNMAYMFNGAKAFNQNLRTNGNQWNVSNVTGMSGMFAGAENFNGYISNWDTSKVENMMSMFSGAQAFNQDISNWDTSKVTNMAHMFSWAKTFNQNLRTNGNKWNVSNVTGMSGMFSQAEQFNGDISNWDTSKVTNMMIMFLQAKAFNQNLRTNGNQWNVSNVTNMGLMFAGAENFNGDISNWDTSKVTNMSSMFANTEQFNQDISNWDTSKVTTMRSMFYRAKVFRQNLRTNGNKWNVSNVTDMNSMFAYAEKFNGDISNWDTNKVTNMGAMFQNAKFFHRDISLWNISSVQDMGGWTNQWGGRVDGIFHWATAFTHDLSSWILTSLEPKKCGFFAPHLPVSKIPAGCSNGVDVD